MKIIALNKTDYVISKTTEYIEFLIYSISALVIPFILGGPQWLVGSLVNTALILAALNIKNIRLLPVIILPSLGILSRGLIFGPFTVFMVYMIPFIWIGNVLIVTSMKLKYNKILNLIIGIASKVIFLFLIAMFLIKLDILPYIFAKSMGLIQLYTAVIGGILAFIVHGLKKAYLVRFNNNLKG